MAKKSDVSTSNPYGFFEQTAKDYDMDVKDVERIFDAFGTSGFYIELEAFIRNREEDNNG